VDAATTSENYMINDLLRVPFKYKYSEVYKEWLEKYPQRLIDTVWQAETGLLEDGLKSTVNGENGVIPREMAEDLKRILELKFDYTKELLGEAGGNLECDRINPTRTLATLSEGEKKRVYAMVSLAFAREVKPTLILLDEPMENQDTRNGNFQLEILRKILANDQPPALMLIAHKFTGQMEKDLNGRVVDMEEKVTGID
jgi:ABC-type dipeptide/oligopeptide/nickel transport system ATPase subunit